MQSLRDPWDSKCFNIYVTGILEGEERENEAEEYSRNDQDFPIFGQTYRFKESRSTENA